MNIDDWLALNPRHRFKCRADTGRTCIQLYGGEGVDQEVKGYGKTAVEAAQNAVDTRNAIKSALP